MCRMDKIHAKAELIHDDPIIMLELHHPVVQFQEFVHAASVATSLDALKKKG